MEDVTYQLFKLIRDAREFKGLQQRCQELLTRGACPFEMREFSAVFKSCAFKELVDSSGLLMNDIRIISAAQKRIRNWPLAK